MEGGQWKKCIGFFFVILERSGLRYNLDVMNVEKDAYENLVGVILDSEGKTVVIENAC